MHWNRRSFVKIASALATTVIATNAAAQRFSPAFRSKTRDAELKSILENATALDIDTKALSINNVAATPIDLANIILAALDKPLADNRTMALAHRADALLRTIRKDNKDYFAFTTVSAPPFDAAEKARLKKMFLECSVGASHKAEIARVVAQILKPSAQSRYAEVSQITSVPWYVIGAIHYREADLNFLGHLHNGDPLDHKTVNVPAGRPNGPWPPVPFDPRVAWRLSAVDALSEFASITNWSVERMLYGFEAYNGFGYRSHHINSPYVWSYSQYYVQGGYPSDNVWSDTYVSKQAGLGLLIKALSDADPANVKLSFES